MKLSLEVNNKTEYDAKIDQLEKVIRSTIQKSKLDFLELKNISVSLAIVSSGEIKEINKKCRKKDKVTDILSFSNYENQELLKKEVENNIFLGELIACWSYIKKSAKINEVSFNEEIARIISHGTLHLLGLEHGEEMFSVQNKVADESIN